MTSFAKLKRQPFFVVLIPLFFVLHGCAENFGLITVVDGSLLLAACMAGVGAVYGLGYWWFRNHAKTSLITAYLCVIYFFFGAIYDFLKKYTGLNRYHILLPVLAIFFVLLLVYLKKNKQPFYRVTIFLNALLSIYILLDLVNISWKMLHSNPDQLSVYNFEKKDIYQPCNSCLNPDIYFLLFDEYSSSRCLQQNFRYDNSAIDNFLTGKGFYILSKSMSNYNFTPFSMASILNMNYLNGIKDVNKITVDDYASCNTLIRNNKVIQFLSSRYYNLVNYSIFDIAGHPSLVEYSLLPVKTRLITAQTLSNRFIHDLGWNFFTGPLEIKWFTKNLVYENLDINNQFFELVKRESEKKRDRPSFIYVHFEMPHWPFYYDKSGRLRDKRVLIDDQTGPHIDSYTGYLPYVNSKMVDMVNIIQENTHHSAVIVVMGDHGYRVALDGVPKDHFFQNFNAVYFPNKDYSSLKDSVSGVNEFRMIFNALFKQSLPLLKDSSIFLTDAH